MIDKRGRSLAVRLTMSAIVLFRIAPALAGQDKIRVHVSDSNSWAVNGKLGGVDDWFGGSTHGGARPQTAEIIKTFGERCPWVTITNNRDKADYVVLLDHEGGKHLILRDNKVVVYNREGDVIHSGSTRSLGNAVKDACVCIADDKKKQP